MKLYRLLIAAAACALSMGANAAWLDTKHDFGAFAEEQGPVWCNFYYVNSSDSPVSIISARASCGCTTPDYSHRDIAPGDTATVTVTYNPAARPGRFTKYVAITLSDGSPMQKLYVSGTVVGSPETVAQRFPVPCGNGIQFSKPTVMMGQTKKGQLRTVFFDAYNRSTDAITPRVTNLPKYINVTVTPEEVPAGEQFTLIFYLHSDRCPLYGLVADTVAIGTGGKEECLLPVTATIDEDFSKLSPKDLQKAPVPHIDGGNTVDFGTIGAGPVSKTVKITNMGKRPMKIRRVYTADPGVSVDAPSTDIKPGKSAQITITVTPKELPGALLNARVAIITNSPDSPTTTLRIVGKI